MNSEDILAGLDEERRALGESAGRGGIVRENAPDGSECRIVYAHCAPNELDDVIREEIARARDHGYTLEWKLYGHDSPADLADRLTAAGLEPDDRESVLVLPLDEAGLASFDPAGQDIRQVTDERGLADYAEIARALGRKNAEEERQRLAAELREAPEAMSIHIAYVDGEPASCGRVYFRPGGPYAELAGGRTRPEHRRKGLFTALVGSRLRQARERGAPTSSSTRCRPPNPPCASGGSRS
ncbi:GNAT family N-acetyltransferase [Streptomyces stramineus]